MSDATTKSAQRVMEILEAFDVTQSPMSLKEICERLNYPLSSGFALLKTLVSLGYLGYDRTSQTYLPTTRITVLGQWVPQQLFRNLNLISIMERLRNHTGHTTFVGARCDLSVQYVHIVYGERLTKYAVPPGTLRPIEQSIFGQLFLSTLNDDELYYTIRKINIKHSGSSKKVDLDALRAMLRKIRADGYAFAPNFYDRDLALLAMLLPEAPFGRTFGIGLGGTADDLNAHLEFNLEALRAAVDAVRQARDSHTDAPDQPYPSPFVGDVVSWDD